MNQPLAVHSIKIKEASRSHIPLCNYLTANILFFLRATKTFQDNLEQAIGYSNSSYFQQYKFHIQPMFLRRSMIAKLQTSKSGDIKVTRGKLRPFIFLPDAIYNPDSGINL